MSLKEENHTNLKNFSLPSLSFSKVKVSLYRRCCASMDNYQPYFDVAALIAKHLRGELTDPEKTELEQWLLSDPRNPELFHKLIDDNLVIDELDFLSTSEKR